MKHLLSMVKLDDVGVVKFIFISDDKSQVVVDVDAAYFAEEERPLWEVVGYVIEVAAAQLRLPADEVKGWFRDLSRGRVIANECFTPLGLELRELWSRK